MSNKNICNGREWLNKASESDTGSIQYSVDLEIYKLGSKKSVNIDAYCDIRDCSRKVSLSFYISNKKQMKRRLKKIDKLIDHLSNFRDGLLKAQKEFK